MSVVIHNWQIYSNTGSLPFMYCLILAGGPFCITGGRVTAPAVSSWFNWYLVLWRTFTTSRERGSPLKALLTGVRAATTSDLVRFTFCLLSLTLCSRSAICFLSGWSSFCTRWMCSSEIQSGLEQFLQWVVVVVVVVVVFYCTITTTEKKNKRTKGSINWSHKRR